MVLLRVDSRLVHGQVIEAWLPYVDVDVICVVDDATVSNPMLREVMSLAVPSHVELFFFGVEEFISGRCPGSVNRAKTLVLCRDLKVAEKLVRSCKWIRKVNVGNLQSGPGKKCLGPTIFLGDEDWEIIQKLREHGVDVDARAVPSDVNLFESF